jgi:predicted metal-dependent HD superfamily phosphohydrolase
VNLKARWRALWPSLAVAAPPGSIFQSLVAAYTQPERAYHNLDHVRDCLAQLDGSRSLAEHALEVELGLWFHDVVYDTHTSDNEAQSAAWALTVLQNADVEPPVAARVSHLILATRHQAAPAGRDAALIVDIDLSILGRKPAEFDRYEANIRREYQWVPEPDFCEARARILETFLRRDRLYQTAAFQARYEAQARANLGRSIKKLRGES